jgi:thiamine biosynthesis lipoprotein
MAMYAITFRAMGCQMTALVDADTPEAIAALAQVPAWFEGWEQSLSRFRADSELNQLNARPGLDTPVSPVLWEVLALAFEAWHASGGLVSPTQLTALEAAGYNRTFEALAKETTSAAEPEWQTPRPAPNLAQSVTLNGKQHSLRLAAGVRLDLGGVAKGWAADETVARLSAFGPALMDAGGDIAVSGPRLGATPWAIGVANPFFPDDALDNLLISSRGGVATSGRDYRRWQRNGRWYHHILDPRTGRPAETDVLTASVLAPSAARAEVAAKVALILGSQAGLAWLAARPELAGCLVLEDGRQIRSATFAAYSTATGVSAAYR